MLQDDVGAAKSARKPYVLCTSVNDAVLHGKPSSYRLHDGDLLSLDFAANVNGWIADSALSIVVGPARSEDLELIALTEHALNAGIAAAWSETRLATSPTRSVASHSRQASA